MPHICKGVVYLHACLLEKKNKRKRKKMKWQWPSSFNGNIHIWARGILRRMNAINKANMTYLERKKRKKKGKEKDRKSKLSVKKRVRTILGCICACIGILHWHLCLSCGFSLKILFRHALNLNLTLHAYKVQLDHWSCVGLY